MTNGFAITSDVFAFDGCEYRGAVFACQGILYIAAISDSRIVGVNKRQVTFRYKKQRSARWRTMSLEVMEFIRRYLQHVLPCGFMKIRYYGFLGSGSSITPDDVRVAIELSLSFFVEKHPAVKKEKKPAPYCPHCRSTLIFYYAVEAEAFIALMKPG